MRTLQDMTEQRVVVVFELASNNPDERARTASLVRQAIQDGASLTRWLRRRSR